MAVPDLDDALLAEELDEVDIWEDDLDILDDDDFDFSVDLDEELEDDCLD